MNDNQPPEELSGGERKAVLEYADPMTDNLLESFNEGVYEKLSQDFDEQMKNLFTPAVFDQSRAMIQGKIGRYRSRVLSSVHKKGPYRVIVYNAIFDMEDEVEVTVSFMRYEEQPLVSGLWFNSTKLREEAS